MRDARRVGAGGFWLKKGLEPRSQLCGEFVSAGLENVRGADTPQHARILTTLTASDHRNEAAVTSNILAATPTWAIILVAVLTGLLGLLSGTAAGAMVTTSHERTERFRERMIEAADAFVEAMVKAEAALRRADELIDESAGKGLQPTNQADSPVPPLLKEAKRL